VLLSALIRVKFFSPPPQLYSSQPLLAARVRTGSSR
jgi:hypothetical protein